MRAWIVVLFLVGCASAQPAQDVVPSCKNILEESWVQVPYTWDVMDDEEKTTMDNGCTYTILTHYFFDDSSGGGAGGSGPDPFHCDEDACDGPYDKRVTYSDPADNLNPVRITTANPASMHD